MKVLRRFPIRLLYSESHYRRRHQMNAGRGGAKTPFVKHLLETLLKLDFIQYEPHTWIGIAFLNTRTFHKRS